MERGLRVGADQHLIVDPSYVGANVVDDERPEAGLWLGPSPPYGLVRLVLKGVGPVCVSDHRALGCDQPQVQPRLGLGEPVQGEHVLGDGVVNDYGVGRRRTAGGHRAPRLQKPLAALAKALGDS